MCVREWNTNFKQKQYQSAGHAEEHERILQNRFIASWAQPAQVCCISYEVSAPTINFLKHKEKHSQQGRTN